MAIEDIGFQNAAKNAAAKSAKTYNQRVVESIKNNTQSTLDVNANQSSPALTKTEEKVFGITEAQLNENAEMQRLLIEAKAAAAEGDRLTAEAKAMELANVIAATIAPQPTPVSNVVPPAAATPVTVTNAATTTLPVVTPAKTNAEIEREMALRNSIEVMRARFKQYNLETLVPKIEQLARDGASEATIMIQLQETPEYKTRFAANESRIKKGLQVLTPAEYLSTEDSYRQVLRSYGLTQFDNDSYVKQFIANDVSPTELSNRVVMAVQRVQNADPAVIKTMKDYYGIGQGDVLAYVLDPEQQLPKIQRQIAAAEIGVAARVQGLETGVAVAEQLAAQGITQGEAQKGYATIADILPTAEKLSAIYGKTVAGYGQAEAEQEVFNSLASAQRKRQKLTATEVAAFGGSAGTTKGTLASQTRGMI